VRIVVANILLALAIVGLHVMGLDIWIAAALGAVGYLVSLFLLGVAPRDLTSLLAERDVLSPAEAVT
jgi:hypothetical protein